MTYEHFLYAPDKAAAETLSAALQSRQVLVPYPPAPSYTPLLDHLKAVHGYEGPARLWADIAAVRAGLGCSNDGCVIAGAWLVIGYTESVEDRPRGLVELAESLGCRYNGSA